MDQISELTTRGTAARTIPDPLRDALLDSRQRWRSLVAVGADLAFETDEAGRLVFISPDPVLGWPADALAGQPAELLLAPETIGSGYVNPFRPTRPTRRRVWLKCADGGLACMMLASAPVLQFEHLPIEWGDLRFLLRATASAMRTGCLARCAPGTKRQGRDRPPSTRMPKASSRCCSRPCARS